MRKWRKTSSFEIHRAITVVREMAKATKRRVARAAVAAKGRVARTREMVSEGATRAKVGQAIAVLRAMGAPLVALRAATASLVAIASFVARVPAAMLR